MDSLKQILTNVLIEDIANKIITDYKINICQTCNIFDSTSICKFSGVYYCDDCNICALMSCDACEIFYCKCEPGNTACAVLDGICWNTYCSKCSDNVSVCLKCNTEVCNNCKKYQFCCD